MSESGYLSLLLGSFEEQRINHCNGVRLDVLIRPAIRRTGGEVGERERKRRRAEVCERGRDRQRKRDGSIDR